LISNEQTAATVDAPERETYVESDTNPTNPATLEVGCDAGTVVISGTDVSVSQQSESVPDLTGSVTETAYAYHTLSIDNTGTLVVRTSDTGEFDASSPDDPPITQVTEESHAVGECYLGTAFQVEGSIERVFDGRYVIGTLPNSIITQGQGSGLDADALRGKTDEFLVPSGGIIMWSGSIAEIPTGWALCDGSGGTPDLTDRFITGAGGQYSVGDTGGADEVKLTEEELASHSHLYDQVLDGGSQSGSSAASSAKGIDYNTQTGETGNDQPHENRPPYYALAFIMKV
jgi:microcystin-dependent protein